MPDSGEALRQRVIEAFADATPLRPEGGGSKSFLGASAVGEPLSLREHSGIITYEPRELVIRARAGTPLAEIDQALAEHRQMLAFEPPAFGSDATIGGTIACGLSGPRRPWVGSARDFVLGVRIVNGRGDALHFGGEVMKNVAGYDVSRLMVGAFGTLGVILDVSLKVLPRPECELTLTQSRDQSDALRIMNASARLAPLSAACWHDGLLSIRLSGAESAVIAAADSLGGDCVADGDAFWVAVKEHRHAFFQPALAGESPLWRLSVAPTSAPLALSGAQFIDWGGAQRWWLSDAPAERIRAVAESAGGHAIRFRGGAGDTAVFHPLPTPLMALHKRLKQAFDPGRILNPGRQYAEL